MGQGRTKFENVLSCPIFDFLFVFYAGENSAAGAHFQPFAAAADVCQNFRSHLFADFAGNILIDIGLLFNMKMLDNARVVAFDIFIGLTQIGSPHVWAVCAKIVRGKYDLDRSALFAAEFFGDRIHIFNEFVTISFAAVCLCTEQMMWS